MYRIPFGGCSPHCDRVNRRDVLHIGATSLFGGLALPTVLKLQATAAGKNPARVKSCIFLMLEGGPSHIDMWDLKPDAPAEIRGPFKPISTSVPGTQISELLPNCARVADKFAIMRSHSHRDNAHPNGSSLGVDRIPAQFRGRAGQRNPLQ